MPSRNNDLSPSIRHMLCDMNRCARILNFCLSNKKSGVNIKFVFDISMYDGSDYEHNPSEKYKVATE